MKPEASEAEVCDEIKATVGTLPEAVLWRITNGMVEVEPGRRVRFGSVNGFFDFVGGVETVITEDMVGQTILEFVGIEAKRRGGKETTSKKRKETQGNISRVVISKGGRAGIARSGDEALQIVKGVKP
jgi:hypothetical protein